MIGYTCKFTLVRTIFLSAVRRTRSSSAIWVVLTCYSFAHHAYGSFSLSLANPLWQYTCLVNFETISSSLACERVLLSLYSVLVYRVVGCGVTSACGIKPKHVTFVLWCNNNVLYFILIGFCFISRVKEGLQYRKHIKLLKIWSYWWKLWLLIWHEEMNLTEIQQLYYEFIVLRHAVWCVPV